jgi:hypothetical protein
MIDGFIDQAVLRAKARMGASEDVLLWLAAAGVLALFAAVFLSVALYVWLAGLYGGAIAALVIGALYVALTAAAIARGTATRRRIRMLARQRIELTAAKPNQWPIDPAMLAVGIELGRAIGWRRLLPIAVVGAGLLAAGWEHSRSRHDPSQASPSRD